MKKYIVHGGIGIAVSLLLACVRFFGGESKSAADVMRAASDGFTVIGFLYMAFLGLGKISSDGFFDIFSYGVKEGIHMLIPGRNGEVKKYYDYKMEKQEKRLQKEDEQKEKKNAVLFVGIFLFVVGIIFTGLFYAVI